MPRTRSSGGLSDSRDNLVRFRSMNIMYISVDTTAITMGITLDCIVYQDVHDRNCRIRDQSDSQTQQMLYKDAITNGDDSRIAPRQHSGNIQALGDASVSAYRDRLLRDKRTV